MWHEPRGYKPSEKVGRSGIDEEREGGWAVTRVKPRWEWQREWDGWHMSAWAVTRVKRNVAGRSLNESGIEEEGRAPERWPASSRDESGRKEERGGEWAVTRVKQRWRWQRGREGWRLCGDPREADMRVAERKRERANERWPASSQDGGGRDERRKSAWAVTRVKRCVAVDVEIRVEVERVEGELYDMSCTGNRGNPYRSRVEEVQR
jgi:hypothetical protein